MITFPRLGKLGRLGNQLFQIAATIGNAVQTSQTAVFPPWRYEEDFVGPWVCRRWLPVFSSRYREPCFEFRAIPQKKSNLRLSGYFQSEKYFLHCRDDIRRVFAPTPRVLSATFSQLPSAEKVSVGIHIRRGDYVQKQNYHPVLPLDYYRRAVSEFPSDTTFLIFTDDADWCERNRFCNATIVKGNRDVEDLHLMSYCTHQIIANSTFSWWAAWLNPNPNKIVIAPGQWFGPLIPHNTSDLLPANWRIR